MGDGLEGGALVGGVGVMRVRTRGDPSARRPSARIADAGPSAEARRDMWARGDELSRCVAISSSRERGCSPCCPSTNSMELWLLMGLTDTRRGLDVIMSSSTTLAISLKPVK
jgi:hypothetical protein